MRSITVICFCVIFKKRSKQVVDSALQMVEGKAWQMEANTNALSFRRSAATDGRGVRVANDRG